MIDVNGTRYHLLMTEADWTGRDSTDTAVDTGAVVSLSGSPPAPDLEWDPDRSGLGLRKETFVFPTPAGDQVPRIEDRRGAAQDRYGNWYWITRSSLEILVLPAGGRAPAHFWSSRDLSRQCPYSTSKGTFMNLLQPPVTRELILGGLAVTAGHYLVAGMLASGAGQAGVLIFDLYAGGPPRQLQWPKTIPFEPFDMSPAPDGGVWVLDRTAKRFWFLDRYFRVKAPDQHGATAQGWSNDFTTLSGGAAPRPGCLPEQAISQDLASPVDAADPVAIEALPDGTVLILDTGPLALQSAVLRYRFRRKLGSLTLLPTAHLTFAVKGHDIAFLADDGSKPGQVTGTVYIAGIDGNQAFAYRVEGDAMPNEPLRRYFPMRLFSGKALAVAGASVYYDLSDQWIPLVEQPRPQFLLRGTIDTRPLDGKELECLWHRLLLDGLIPPGTSVTVESRCANRQEDLAYLPWQEEPRLYRRADGSELPYSRPFPPDEADLSRAGTWELLLQRSAGRFLQLRLTFTGNKRSTPVIRSLRVYYPRFSYLKEYLPAAYRQDRVSASFLDRFLANAEGTYTAMEAKIAEVQVLFDIRIAPPKFLDWLGGWFGVVFDPQWEEYRRRLFLRHVMELFRQRGTVEGLIRAVRLATDPCPDDTLFEEDLSGFGTATNSAASRSIRVVEQFRVRSAPGVVYGDPTDAAGPGVISVGTAWTPAHGAGPFHQGFREHLKKKYRDPKTKAPDIALLKAAWGSDYQSFDEVRFSPVPPAGEGAVRDWHSFVRDALNFTYAEATSADAAFYRDFLARRYRFPTRLNDEYQWTGANAIAGFQEIDLPGEADMPSGGTRLYDWIQFVSLVLPIKRNAHRFSVLVPVDLSSSQTEQERILGRVRRVVELEKPAHTSFEVKPYWALFRVGEVRLGYDTLLDQGARFAALALGRGNLGGSFLEPPDAWRSDRPLIAGRDALGEQGN